MGQVTLTITDTTNPFWRRWDFTTKAGITTNLTHANISPNGSSATALKFALNPTDEPIGAGARIVKFGIPGKDASYLQATGAESLVLTYSGELHDAPAGTTNYDFSADPTQSAIADRDCLLWAFFKAVTVTLTMSDGTSIPNLVVSKFAPIRSGQVKRGYKYELELIEKIIP
jgi:hypothetical protein